MTLGQSGPGSDGNEGVLHILLSSSTGALLSDGLMSYPGHSFWGGSYPSAEMQLVYFTIPANWAKANLSKFVFKIDIISLLSQQFQNNVDIFIVNYHEMYVNSFFHSKCFTVSSFYHFEYSDHCLHLHNVLADTSFGLLQVYYIELRSLHRTLN